MKIVDITVKVFEQDGENVLEVKREGIDIPVDTLTYMERLALHEVIDLNEIIE